MQTIEEKWQQGVSLAVERHPVLARKAFQKEKNDKWVLRKGVLKEGYGSTEAMVLAVLVEMHHELWGLWEIDIPRHKHDKPSQILWEGAPAVVHLFNRLDVGQLKIIGSLFK